jgi:hypothetical protein
MAYAMMSPYLWAAKLGWLAYHIQATNLEAMWLQWGKSEPNMYYYSPATILLPYYYCILISTITTPSVLLLLLLLLVLAATLTLLLLLSVWPMMQFENFTLRWLFSHFCVFYMFLIIVIKPWETSIPMQKLSHALLMFGLDVSHGSMTVMILILYSLYVCLGSHLWLSTYKVYKNFIKLRPTLLLLLPYCYYYSPATTLLPYY